MNTKENCLRALGNLVSMAIDNTKGSKSVDICHKEILAYIGGLETENDKVWQRYKEEHNQICKAIQFIKENDGKPMLREYYDNDLLNILKGE